MSEHVYRLKEILVLNIPKLNVGSVKYVCSLFMFTFIFICHKIYMSSPKIAWDEFSTWTNILMACRFRLNLPIFSSRFWANQRGLCARRFPEISV